MSTTTANARGGQWDTAAIRRAMRVLCAQPADVHDAMSTARGLRILWDILQRRGSQAEVYQVPGVMPLLVVGNGPIVLCTYLDDQSPPSDERQWATPAISGNAAEGPGVTRIAGLLGALGPIASGRLHPSDVTLVVEADRHFGSPAIQSWLNSSEHDFTFALWETADLPVPTPAVFQSSTGSLTLSVTVRSTGAGIESFYSGVLPDIGHRLVEALAGLKSRDSEVLVPGFYDNVDAPDSAALTRLNSIANGVQTWVSGAADERAIERQLSATHVTLGVFCAPSIMVRSIEMHDSQPFLAQSATATLEARLMPGQDANAVVRVISEHLRAMIPDVSVDTVLVRQPYNGSRQRLGSISELATVYPVAPGDSPAGVFGTLGIPSLGFATVSRSPERAQQRVELSSVVRAGEFVRALCQQAAGLRGQPS